MDVTLYNRNSITTIVNQFDVFENMRFETDRIGGPTVAEFEVRRNILNEHTDLQVYNPIIISDGSTIAWEGFIAEPKRTSPASYNVSCLGWISHLGDTGYYLNLASMKMSSYVTAVILVDGNVSPFISAGSISTADYLCPAMEDIAPWKTHLETLDNYNKWNDWRYYMSEGRKFNLAPPQTVAKWIVLAEDAPGFEISDSPANYWNVVSYSYTLVGSSEKLTGMATNAASIATYGRVVVKYLDISGEVANATQAQAIANIYLNHGSTMTAMGQIKTQKVYDAVTYEPVEGWRVKGGDVVKIQDFLAPSAYIGNVADELTTMEIKTAQYERVGNWLTITPKDWDSGLEPLLTRIGGNK